MSEHEGSELDSVKVAALQQPGDPARWERLEKSAAELDEPEEVAGAYREALAGDPGPELAVELGRRAARFHEEWFGDDSSGLAALLERVLELSPASEWAFQQLTVVLTVSERWKDVLDLYDRSFAAAATEDRKIQLLEEAYQVAKDLADKPERAIDYLKAKLALDPDVKQRQALERLLQKHERWADLIALWREDLPQLEAPRRNEALQRIAECSFENLGDSSQALEALRELLDRQSPAEDEAACALLETLIASDKTPLAVREDALLALRHRYEASGRERQIIGPLKSVLPLADLDERRALLEELGERLAALGEHSEAMESYAALLVLEPGSATAQKLLRRQAEETAQFDSYARSLVAAAEVSADPNRKVALLRDAAETRVELLADPEGAIELLARALEESGIDSSDILTIGRRLVELLALGGRHGERLDVLDRLVAAESVDSSRRALIGDAASLAEELGEVDRALAGWRSRLESDPGDLRALERLIQLLERDERWPALIAALERRLESDVPASQKRADWLRIAAVYEERLGAPEKALEAYREAQARFGDDLELLAALSRILKALGRWRELAALLEDSSRKHTEHLAEELVGLGRAYREAMNDEAAAVECYRRALTIDPRDSGAREGLKSLLGNEESRSAAAEALVLAYRGSGDLVGLLELSEARLATSGDPQRERDVLREAMEIAEGVVSDGGRALDYAIRLLPLVPRDRALEDRTVELARAEGRLADALGAMRAAAPAFRDDAHALAGLRMRAAAIAEEADDSAMALVLYIEVAAAQPGNLEALGALCRLGGREERWRELAERIAAATRELGTLPEEALAAAAAAAREKGALGAWTAALAAAAAAVPQRHGAELLWRTGGWLRDELDDAAAAEAALSRAAELAPRREEVHRALAALQRRAPGEALHATLCRLRELGPDDLDVFAEAAAVAGGHLDAAAAESSVRALLRRATAAWRGTSPATSEREPREWVLSSAEELARRYVEDGRGREALELLAETSRLPFAEETRISLANRAAEVADEVLGDAGGAIEAYRSVLAARPGDATALAALAALYRREGRLPELLSLRRHELEVTDDSDRKRSLRLEVAALLDEVESATGRLELLSASLEETPGHRESILALSRYLRRLSRDAELADMLASQAERLEESDRERAAELWGEVATLAEEPLGDIDRALRAHRKVAELAPTPRALDALARLYTARDQPGAAIPWLEQALQGADDEARAPLVVRLARAHLAAERPGDAIALLERELEKTSGPMLEIRETLIGLLRADQAWRKLADALTEALPYMGDDEAISVRAREAAALYHDRLETPAAAFPALSKALELVPGDATLRAMMAVSLRADGQFSRARELLEGLIADFGRRRSKERAAIHVELARVARAEGALDEAMAELELAAKMDAGNAHILRSLAELSRDQGQLDQAEKSLRQLLLVVRRQAPTDEVGAVGLAEVLFELRHIAAVRGDSDKADELLESVLEAAAVSDLEAIRLRRTLLEHGEHRLLEKVLRARVEQSADSELKIVLCGHLGDLLEETLEDLSGALEVRLAALRLAPEQRLLHEQVRELATRLGATSRYVDTVEEIVGAMRRDEDSSSAGKLLLRAAHACESDLGDLERAQALYRQAEEALENPTEALSAGARVAASRGDTAEQTRTLDELATLAIAEGPSAAQADALYRLAALQSSSPELVERCLEILDKALEVEPRYPLAGEILRAVADSSGDAEAVLAMYERVARSGSDRGVRLDFLERRARLGQAPPETLREAADLAAELGEVDRERALLERAVAAARETPGGVGTATWAGLRLLRQRTEAGELASAAELLFALGHSFGSEAPAELAELGRALGERAGEEGGDLELAERIYEFLLESEPRNRRVWEPLLGIYRRHGEGEKFSALVDRTLPALLEAGERNALRVEKSRYLVALDRDEEAIEVLRDALLDDADDLVASSLLEDVLRRGGNEEALADFLRQRFEEALQGGVSETVEDVALRLGKLFEEHGGGSPDAIYRQGLSVARESAPLMRALLGQMESEELAEHADLVERADLEERLLRGSGPESAPALALELAARRQSLGDLEGAQRALELGRERAPDDAPLRRRLEEWYRDAEAWKPLASLLETDAERQEEDAAAISLLREAAAIHRDYLSDLPRAAAVLGAARERAPADAELASLLASCQAAAGDYSAAIAMLSEVLEIAAAPAKVDLWRLRADLLSAADRHGDAVRDLEAAYAVQPRELLEPLVAALERMRLAAERSENHSEERSATLRLVALAEGLPDEAEAEQRLRAWVERHPKDAEALHLLLERESRAERWEGVAAACDRLCYLESGSAQVDAALRLVDAAESAGSPELARAALEHVYRAQTGERRAPRSVCVTSIGRPEPIASTPIC